MSSVLLQKLSLQGVTENIPGPLWGRAQPWVLLSLKTQALEVSWVPIRVVPAQLLPIRWSLA